MGLIKTGIMAGVGYAAVNKVTNSLERSRQSTPTPTPTPPRQIPQHQCSCPYCPGLYQDHPQQVITSGHGRGYAARITQRASPDYREARTTPDYRDVYDPRETRESPYSPDPREYREYQPQAQQLRQRVSPPTTNDYPFPPAYAPSEGQSGRAGGGLGGGGGFIEEIVTGLSGRSGKGGWQ